MPNTPPDPPRPPREPHDDAAKDDPGYLEEWDDGTSHWPESVIPQLDHQIVDPWGMPDTGERYQPPAEPLPGLEPDTDEFETDDTSAESSADPSDGSADFGLGGRAAAQSSALDAAKYEPNVPGNRIVDTASSEDLDRWFEETFHLGDPTASGAHARLQEFEESIDSGIRSLDGDEKSADSEVARVYLGTRNFASASVESKRWIFGQYLAWSDTSHSAPTLVAPSTPEDGGGTTKKLLLVGGTIGVIALIALIALLNGGGSETAAPIESPASTSPVVPETPALVEPSQTEDVVEEVPEEPADETPEESAAQTNPTVPSSMPGSGVLAWGYKFSSHHFTVTVDGDGEAVTLDPGLQWYQAIITAETPEGPIRMDYTFGTWGSKGRLFDENNRLIVDAEVTGAWLNPATLVINLDSDLFPSPAESAEIEILVRLTDEDGKERNSFSSASWEP